MFVCQQELVQESGRQRDAVYPPHWASVCIPTTFYLPREFPQIFVTVVYIHPKADADMATRAIANTVNRLQGIALDALNLVIRDFNHCKPGKTLCNFEQYVMCPTRLTNCLDLSYGLVKGAYKSLRRAPLGMSDHYCVYLVSSYKPVPRKHKLECRLVPVWSHDSIQHLQDCFSQKCM